MNASAKPIKQSISAPELIAFVSRLFSAVGVPSPAANAVARGLVEADLEGLTSHGVMLVDMYIERLRKGSVSQNETATVVSDRNGAVVFDAGNALGHLTGVQAMAKAIEKARAHTTGIVAVRHGFHFGTAGRYALQAAEQNCVGIAMCNTRPLMPAPGGAERVVGNNPIAFAIPTDGPIPILLDMATSEAAMGKIRMAEKAGKPIPQTWAVTVDGAPTTNPTEAINGMLLPAAGPKGFALSFIIDMLCGLLSQGAFGSAVRPLYGDFAVPYDCSHLFIAIDVSHFCDVGTFRQQAAAAAGTIRNGKRAPGVEKLFSPGEPEWRRRETANGVVDLDPAVVGMLTRYGAELGIAIPSFLPPTREAQNA